jgi:hypothetical protein
LKDTFVVLPRNSETNDSLWLGHDEKGTFVKLAVFGVLKERQYIQGHFLYCLKKGRLIGIPSAQVIEESEIWFACALR